MPRLSLFVAAATAVGASAACADVETQSDFNLTEYVRASWYIQKQQVNGYQSEDRLNCVVATYNETYHGTPSSVPFFGGTVLTVFNDCNVGEKNGPVSNNYTSPDFKRSFASPLCARQTSIEHPERLEVAPCLLPNFFAGNYWVLHAGPSPDNYEYAAVIAGQPTVEKEDGCTTPDTCSGPAQTGCGLWLFTREPVPDVSKVALLEDVLHTKGVSTQLLKEIDHTDCTYEGFVIKGDASQRQRLMV
jgi:hypothetical protein